MAIFNVEETFCKSTAEVLLCKLVTLTQYHINLYSAVTVVELLKE